MRFKTIGVPLPAKLVASKFYLTTGDVINITDLDINENVVSPYKSTLQRVVVSDTTNSVSYTGSDNTALFSGCSSLRYVEIPDGPTVSGPLFIGAYSNSVEFVIYKYYSSQLFTTNIGEQGLNTTYVVRFLTNATPSSSQITTMFIRGSSKEAITYNFYTDVEDLAIQCKSYADQYTITKMYHLDGTEWDFAPSGTYTEGYLTYTSSAKVELISCDTAATGTITIPNTVTKIDANAFQNCSQVSTVTIPSSVTDMGDTIFSGSIKSGLRINVYRLYSAKLIPAKSAGSGSGASSTYNIYFYDIASIPSGWAMTSMLGYGASKNTITYNMYTDNEELKNLSVSFGNGNSYTTVNVKHLNGSAW